MLNWQTVYLYQGGGQFINVTITRLIIICRLSYIITFPSLCFYRSFSSSSCVSTFYSLSLVKHFQYGEEGWSRSHAIGGRPSSGVVCHSKSWVSNCCKLLLSSVHREKKYNRKKKKKCYFVLCAAVCCRTCAGYTRAMLSRRVLLPPKKKKNYSSTCVSTVHTHTHIYIPMLCCVIM
jgi:hypothetical protein